MKKSLFAFVLVAASMTLAHSSFASEEGPPAVPEKPMHPATRYSGASPIDLTHGLPFNNGTFGLPNKEYESWAQGPYLAVGVSAKTYPYVAKNEFVNGMKDRLAFFSAAIYNWQQKSDITKPEAVEYAKNAIATIEPKLDAARDALSKAEGAGSGDWDRAQDDARKAMASLLGTYYQLHHNVVAQ